MSRKWVPDSKCHLSLLLLLFSLFQSLETLGTWLVNVLVYEKSLNPCAFPLCYSLSSCQLCIQTIFWETLTIPIGLHKFLRHMRLVSIIGYLLFKFLFPLSDSFYGHWLLITELPAPLSAFHISFWITQAPFSITGPFLSNHLLSFLKVGLLDDALTYFLYSPAQCKLLGLASLLQAYSTTAKAMLDTSKLLHHIK